MFDAYMREVNHAYMHNTTSIHACIHAWMQTHALLHKSQGLS